MAKGIARWFSHIVFQAKIQTYHACRGIAAANNPLNPDNKAGMSDSVPTAKLNDLADRLNRCGKLYSRSEMGERFFGEGCLTGQPLRLCSATAMTDCSVMRIDKKSMMEVLHRDFKEIPE